MLTETGSCPVLHALAVRRDNQARRRRFLTMYFALAAAGLMIAIGGIVLPH
jgi:hypothetical protein